MCLRSLVHTDCGDDEFQIWMLDETNDFYVTDRQGDAYLILYDLECWYDAVQGHTAVKRSCDCESDWFNLHINYWFYLDGEVRELRIVAICAVCKMTALLQSRRIRHMPTIDLITKPIIYCMQPLIQFQQYWMLAKLTRKDFNRVLRFLYEDLGLTAYCRYFKRDGEKWSFEQLTPKKAQSLRDNFLQFYFVKDGPRNLRLKRDNLGEGVGYDYWREAEAICINKSAYINDEWGKVIMFGSQYLKGYSVVNKTPEFAELTNRLHAWLLECFPSDKGHKYLESPALRLRRNGG